MFEGANPRQSTWLKCNAAIKRVQEHLFSILLLWFLLDESYIYIMMVDGFHSIVYKIEFI